MAYMVQLHLWLSSDNRKSQRSLQAESFKLVRARDGLTWSFLELVSFTFISLVWEYLHI
jgi:hypothetical protein